MKRRFTEELTGRLKEKAEGIKRSEDEVTDPIQDAAFIRPLHDGDGDTPRFDRYEDDDMETFEEPPSEEDDPAEFDKFVGAKIRENEDGIENFGVVKGRKRDAQNNFIGRYHANQYLDTSIYEVEFEDKRVEYYRANEIVEALLMNIDDEGNTLLHVREIVDHRRDGSAVRADDGMITINGRQKPRRTTKGWEICVEVQGGETEWIDLKTAKESYPVLVAEYAVANKLVSEPAFAWWVPYTLKKRDRVLKAVNRRALTRKSEKFGLEVPSSGPRGVKRAYEIDGETGTEYWGVAMKKEVGTVLPALKVLEPNESVPPGFVRIDLMTVFDVKMDLTRKARICARGDQTDPPLSVTYASVVTRESIRIGFTIAALNGLNVLSADIAGAYLNAPCAEKIYTILGPEFGDLEGRTAIVVKALYGLKSSGFSWRSTLAKTLRESMGFTPCRGDQDVWRREAQRADKSRYYEYLFVYTDDVIAISENPDAIMKKLGTFYLLKPDSVQEPKTFLGATISKCRMDGTDYDTWTIGSKAYLVEALRVVKQRIAGKKYHLQLQKKVKTVLPSGYKPELDGSKEVDDETAIVYMQFVGILRWLVELGRIDVAAGVSMMSAYNAMPRVGHFHAVLHMFAYLENNLDWELAMDCRPKEWNVIPEQSWKEFYPFAKDELPPDMPEPLGKAVELTMFVDASHAANVVTRQSRTGVIIYVMGAPVIWFSKKQNSIETSSFGSEFMALKTGIELLEGLRYKLRMMGVPIDGYCSTFVDNNSVVVNTSSPESTLKKKSNSIAYHFARAKSAADVLRIDWVPTDENCADILTKLLTGTKTAELRLLTMYRGDDDPKEMREIQTMNRYWRMV